MIEVWAIGPQTINCSSVLNPFANCSPEMTEKEAEVEDEEEVIEEEAETEVVEVEDEYVSQ